MQRSSRRSNQNDKWGPASASPRCGGKLRPGEADEIECRERTRVWQG
ncbi:hypothetical protein ACP_0789 [Acidobacterium capsulatum ATCC 51196]|uniref:Uncharacterized protein n=1 Tax=Acidobacterium capsulatum (strain ATCC 51196 / DSM 11244 / BCRC 80197 / JCM 7670 / NBRC 15755 / NCIMB 13165 / 161) TaxID=240015 RepID=C1F2C6_ACIC5|nr:hypothetical protein ACP_0789 [Acidobacterium capsulatum ATCC 51196]